MAYPTVSAPYGFKPVNRQDGMPYAGATTQYAIKSVTTTIKNGDLVLITAGEVAKSGVTNNSTTATNYTAGVFMGCQYVNTQGQTVQAQYYPGNAAASSAIAYVVVDPQAAYKVAVTDGSDAVSSTTVAAIGVNLAVDQGTGSTTTGDSANGVVAPSSGAGTITTTDFTATASQTAFSVTRNANYINGQCWVFQNGCLLNQDEYTDTNTTVTLDTGADVGDQIAIISFRAISSGNYYDPTGLVVHSVVGAVVTYDSVTLPYQSINAGDIMTFSNSGTPTQYTVSSVNYATYEITFTASVTATAGDSIYTYRSAGSSYPVFSRFSASLSNASDYTPTEWAFHSGYELPFMNGTIVPDQDYDIISNTYSNLPSTATGDLEIIQFSANNTTTPTGTPTNAIIYTTIGQDTYTFAYTSNAFNLYENGVLLVDPDDYTTGTGQYTLDVVPTDNITILQQQTYARIGAA